MMSNMYFAQHHHVDVEPTRMQLLEMLEKRRFSLSLLCAFTLLSSFSDVFANSQYSLNVKVFSHNCMNIIQSLL